MHEHAGIGRAKTAPVTTMALRRQYLHRALTTEADDQRLSYIAQLHDAGRLLGWTRPGMVMQRLTFQAMTYRLSQNSIKYLVQARCGALPTGKLRARWDPHGEDLDCALCGW